MGFNTCILFLTMYSGKAVLRRNSRYMLIKNCLIICQKEHHSDKMRKSFNGGSFSFFDRIESVFRFFDSSLQCVKPWNALNVY